MPTTVKYPATVTGTDDPTTLTVGPSGTGTAHADGRPFEILGVYVHAGAALGAEDITLSLDSGTSTAYDTTIDEQNMSGETDYVWVPYGRMVLNGKDDFKVSVVNGGGQTIGITVHWGLIEGSA